MKSIDLTKFIEGFLILILASIAIGKYSDLRAFAEREAAASLHGWGSMRMEKAVSSLQLSRKFRGEFLHTL
jgi:hypothetical protein